MAALLSLISPRVVFYGILASLLLAFGIHYRNLEHEVKQAKVVAAAATANVKKVDAVAQTTETQSVLIYKQAVQIPAVGDIGVECVRKQPSGGALPAPDTKPGTPTGEQPSDGGAGLSYDPSGAALTRGAQANAQIAYLQRRIKELETQMNNSP